MGGEGVGAPAERGFCGAGVAGVEACVVEGCVCIGEEFEVEGCWDLGCGEESEEGEGEELVKHDDVRDTCGER